MGEIKTNPTKVDYKLFLKSISESRRQEAEIIISIMQDISRLPAVMWGPSIIGFGQKHYKSEAGTEGDTFLIGFSPRKANLTIYFYEGFNHYDIELKNLGKFKLSQGCLYINNLTDINLEVLKDMLKKSYQINSSATSRYKTVQEYLDQVPENAIEKVLKLREIIKSIAPNCNEVISYGIIGYRVDNKRARVFISGWKDHVAIYPVPKSENLKKDLEPYIKGKGTLWFSLDRELPVQLIKKVVKELVKT